VLQLAVQQVVLKLTRSCVQGYKNRSVFSKIVKNRWNRTGLNLKTTVKKDKNQQNICKKLDQILRLLVKIFFIKSGRLGW
jgi:hypothetical protein